MPATFKNVWGSQSSTGLDQQRADLYYVTLSLPPVLGGAQKWTREVEFALTEFPFPERARDMVPTKFLNQTNYQLGPDKVLGEIKIPVRYAFNWGTAQLLERWHMLCSNARTGGVGLTTKCKCTGEFTWLIPNQSAQETFSEVERNDTYTPGLKFTLEGCLIAGLTPGKADTNATGDRSLVMYEFTLSLDRYYPKTIGNGNMIIRQ